MEAPGLQLLGLQGCGPGQWALETQATGKPLGPGRGGWGAGVLEETWWPRLLGRGVVLLWAAAWSLPRGVRRERAWGCSAWLCSKARVSRLCPPER